jgi:hypothetical protein
MQRFLLISFLLLMVPVASAENSDAVCANCHKAIYDSYQATPMARASGLASEGLLPGEFTHADSGVHYRLFLRDGRAWLSFDRPGTLKGEQELSYFIGSGQRGRTYLFQKQGFWFESPVNWYSKQQVWDMNPKSIGAHEMPFTLKVDAGCLHCHTTGVQVALRAEAVSARGYRLPVVSRRSRCAPSEWRKSADLESSLAIPCQARLDMFAMSS